MTQRDRDYDDFYDDLNDNEYLDEYDELFFDDDEPPEVGEQLPDFEIERHQSPERTQQDRKSTRLNSSHVAISYAVFCLKKKNKVNLQRPKSSQITQIQTQNPHTLN